MSHALVLIVADEPDFIAELKSRIPADHEVDVAESAAEALTFCESSEPDVVVLDSDLPDTEGFNLCRQLRESTRGGQLVILQAMASDQSDDRGRAFEQGADDVLFKPLPEGSFEQRLTSLMAHRLQLKSLAEASQEAQKLALQSMTESAMYGTILGFFRQAIICTTYEQLVEAFFELMGQFGLSSVIQIRGGRVMTWSAPGVESSPVEANLFDALKDAGRLYHFGARTLVNDVHVSFLVKNMPVEDELAYGRYKDLVAVVIEGLQSACQTIRRNDLIRHLFEELKGILADVHANFGQDDSRVMQALRRLQHTLPEIHSSLHFLDINEDQEAYFENLLDKGVVETETLVSFLRHLQGSLERLGSRLGL